jgi:predicted DNA-binding protein (MmcQ/YjbR family)
MTTMARAKAICAKLPGATHDVKWGKDHCYSVGGKMFAVIGPDASMSFKVEDGRFLELTDREGMIPAPYMAKHKWVLVQDLKTIAEAELQELVATAHGLILAKLPKKTQREIAGD